MQVKQISEQRGGDLKRKEPEAMPKPILGPAPTGPPAAAPAQAPPTLPPPPPRPAPTALPPPPQVGICDLLELHHLSVIHAQQV